MCNKEERHCIQCGAAFLELQDAETAASKLIEESAVESPAPPHEAAVYPCQFCRNAENRCHCGTCEECEYIRTEDGLSNHMMNGHEPSEVIKSFGKQWCRERLGIVDKRQDYAQDRKHSRKWDKIIPFLTEQERSHIHPHYMD